MPIAHRMHARCASAACRHGLAPRAFALPGSTRKFERDRPFSVRHIALDLALDVPNKSVAGTAKISLTRVSESATEVVLDAVAFEIASVRVDGKDVAFVYDGESLTVPIGERAKEPTIDVRYRATPRRGLYFLAPDEHVRDRPTQVWTQCQDEDARTWFPCIDKPHLKQTTELKIRVPKGWYALSNGGLVDRSSDKEGEVFHWKIDKPHPTYLVTLVAGEFAEIDGGKVGDVPVTYLVPKGREADGKRTFHETPKMIAHFAKLIGVPFPWNKYAQIVVSDFIFGGMENTSATTMYEYILLDERAALDITSDDLIAHELAHQWFGDFVTCRDWSHGWLNEGFATYFEHLDKERKYGLDEYEYGVRQDESAYLGEARGRYARPIVCHDYDVPIDLFDRHLYEKGGLVLHMLRRQLGDDVFFRGIGAYLKKHAYGVVETRDLLRALEEASGKSLERFFDQWVFRAGHPELDVRLGWEAGVVTVAVKQKQKLENGVGLFNLPLAVDIVDSSGKSRRERFEVERADETFAFACKERPAVVFFDPELAVVGEISVDAPADMLRAQLAKGPTARARGLAAEALGRRDEPASEDALAAALADEKLFWGSRAEAAAALAKLRTPRALETLVGAAKTKHPKVRRAVANALGHFRKAEAAAALAPLALSDASYVVESEAARALGGTRQSSAFDTLVEIIDRPSWSDVLRVGSIDGLAALRDDRATPHVLARTRYGVPTRARRAAIRALPKLSTDRKTREHLEDLLDDADPHLRIDVALALADLGDARSRGALTRALERDLDGRVRRRLREIIRDLGGAAKANDQRTTDELDRVRGELSELRARLAKLEAGKESPPPSVKPTSKKPRKKR